LRVGKYGRIRSAPFCILGCLFAGYKGEAEKALLAARFPHVYVFRPAYIYPVEPRTETIFSYHLLRGIFPAFRVLSPNQVIRPNDLAPAMVDVDVRGTAKRGGLVFENRDIPAMVESLHAHKCRANETMNEHLHNDILVEDSTCVVMYNSPDNSRCPRCN
jgi:hypothetical protein